MNDSWRGGLRGPLCARMALAVVVAGCASVPDPIPLPTPTGGEVRSGVISPDGRSFAYGVVPPDSSLQVWLLDLETRAAAPLTRGPGRRYDPTWSPDGERLAVWDSRYGPAARRGPGGIFVIDVGTGDERAVFRPRTDLGYVEAPSWLAPDTIAFRYSRSFGAHERWIVAADGTGARKVDDARYSPGRSPDGSRLAYVRECCDSWQHGLWISTADGEDRPAAKDARCVAGPLGHPGELAWAPTGNVLLLTSRPHRDSSTVLWRVAADRPGARRVRTPPGGEVGRVSVAATGRAAVQIRDPTGKRRLWLLADAEAAPTEEGGALAGCPSLHPAAAAMAREAGIGGELRIRETYKAEEYAFRQLTVAYDFDELRHMARPMVAVGDRIGWTGAPCGVSWMHGPMCPARRQAGDVTFRPRAGEAFLWSASFLDRLARDQREDDWIRVLLAMPGLPVSAIDSLLVDGRFDGELVRDARVAERPDRLLALWARHPGRAGVGPAVFEAAWRLGAELAAEPTAPDDLLLDLAAEVPRRGAHDSLAAPIGRALLANPRTRADPAILSHLARLSRAADSEIFRVAGARLLDDGSVTAEILASSVANLAVDPALADRLFADHRVREDPRLLRALARTPWQTWRVAERARRLATATATDGHEGGAGSDPRNQAAPLVMPDAWGESVFVGDRWELRRALESLDPLSEHIPPLVRMRASRASLEVALCGRARTDAGGAGDAGGGSSRDALVAMAEGAVYATSTRLAACLLENPAVRADPGLLELLASMIDVNHVTRFPGAGDPSVADIRRRARDLLR